MNQILKRRRLRKDGQEFRLMWKLPSHSQAWIRLKHLILRGERRRLWCTKGSSFKVVLDHLGF
ncbi:hypothetical protein SESBI_46565 [Sesbania bispinosa]|nr:hypothetical protein SESBI_46565 [Sesbania bispinosa]